MREKNCFNVLRNSATMKLSLRRTLVRSEQYSTFFSNRKERRDNAKDRPRLSAPLRYFVPFAVKLCSVIIRTHKGATQRMMNRITKAGHIKNKTMKRYLFAILLFASAKLFAVLAVQA